MQRQINLSSLPKTWCIDLDGTILKHNLEYENETDDLLEGVGEFWKKYIKTEDTVILMTNRASSNRLHLERFLNFHNLRYDLLICDLPNGERVCINDIKPSSGLKTAAAINVVRNEGVGAFTITRNG